MIQHGNGRFAPHQKLRAKTILIVEEDGAIAQLLMDLIALMASYHLLLASNTSQALDLVHYQRVDLFLLTNHLSHGPNGLELFDQLHGISGGEQVPAILISPALPPEQIASRTISVLHQPFTFYDLLACIQWVLTEYPLP